MSDDRLLEDLLYSFVDHCDYIRGENGSVLLEDSMRFYKLREQVLEKMKNVR